MSLCSIYVCVLCLATLCMLCWAQDPHIIYRPGKRGPQGQKGSKGEVGDFGIPGLNGQKGAKGSDCACPGYDEMQATIRKQEKMIKLAGKGWSLYEHGSKQYWYKISTIKTTHSGAKSHCLRMGGAIATAGMRISSVFQHVTRELARQHDHILWIGLDDLYKINTWRWQDGVLSTPFNTAWGRNQPNSSNERCGVLYNGDDYRVHDIPCHHSHYYLCEKVL